MALAGTAQPALFPSAVVDLSSQDGIHLVKGEWRFCDANIVDVDHRLPGPDLKASGKPNRTHDIEPQAGAKDFDDSNWSVIDPSSLNTRRSGGRLAFGWYRLKVTVPERLGVLKTSGGTIVFEIVVDDYAEVWVDGHLPQVLGQSGGAMAAGWNAPNRVVLTRQARPGQVFHIAVFAANGPLSRPPGNFVWVRSATLEFFKSGAFCAPEVVPLEVDRRDSALNAIVPADATLEKIAGGFTFTEGPVWIPAEIAGAGNVPIDMGYLLFSDPNRNTIFRCNADGDVSVFRAKSGYKGIDIGAYRQPGSNGLTLDREGRLTICEHGNRRIARLEKSGALTVLADRYDDKRLNSPNDLVYRSDGALYFTDPFFGLPKFRDDPRREQDKAGVYCLNGDTLALVSSDLSGPNGLAFSPDEKSLYVANWDDKKKVLMRYDVSMDGSLSNGIVFFDMTDAPGDDALDGVKVDTRGNLYVSGPGGLWIISPEGRHLGTLRGPEHPHNLAWGDEDGRSLYWAAQSSIYRLRLRVMGILPMRAFRND